MSSEASPLRIGVVRETFPGEDRVALVPASVATLCKKGLAVTIESSAGAAAGFPDEAYEKVGASIGSDRGDVISQSDVLLQVRMAGANPDHCETDLQSCRDGQTVIATAEPLAEASRLQPYADRQLTSFALELLPRITRAQSMDILSSMATIAGYKAVLIAADALPRMFPMMMTAAGTLTPAKVLVIGAGVAGLQAIATAKRLGAVVYGYDIRPAVREQVESLGGRFVELDLKTETSEQSGGYAKQMGEEFYRRQRELMTEVISDCHAVITTAAIPGKKAPTLVTREMAEAMAPGSVIVDLAAERGGNCEVTVAAETIDHQGVKVCGPVNLPAALPYHASEMFSRNVTTFLFNLIEDGQLNFNLEDEIIRDTMVTHGGDIVNPRVREILELPPLATETDTAASETSESGDSASTES